MSETFGSFILQKRKEKGISQKVLATRILREEDGKPISPQYLNDIERDRRNPTSDHLINQFASALDLQAEYLFYLAGTLPQDVRAAGAKPEEVVRFFNAFRKSTR
ncbi:transcriptional regulator with XRE-family HTH domain [Methylobacterium sp. BE186]|uniref:helix-turn-helix domain-containing protein n=1 Tax=Methylobacterium sp. BE186 TaxID=2817715 RepID=UPI0028616FE2|nr:helix-turn-helix transcriptional regulator [Methylobacterium sp. BE186]MDR7039120.1 transcriptional regulator with XRE-family HTH domain [Methylobacterium sp. BE186]